MNHKITDVMFAIVVVALVLVATRPGSQAPKVISALGGSFADSIKAATGSGGGGGKSSKKSQGRR